MDKSISEHRLGEPLTTKGVTIIPIEKVNYSSSKMGDGVFLSGSKEPVAVIIVTADGVKAIDIRSHEISLSDIHKMAPDLTDGLDQCLSKFSRNDIEASGL